MTEPTPDTPAPHIHDAPAPGTPDTPAPGTPDTPAPGTPAPGTPDAPAPGTPAFRPRDPAGASTEAVPFPAATVLGYPRIGPRRELKRALEAYWAGEISGEELAEAGRELRAAAWRRLVGRGLDAAGAAVPSNTFSLYDHVLDTVVLVGAVPARYRSLGAPGDPDADLRRYFAMARGETGVAPLRMTKWFDTNYHHLVPEIGPDTRFELAGDKPLAEFREAAALGVVTRPVLVGPVTFLLLAEAPPGAPVGFRPLDRLDDVLAVYARLLRELADAGAPWVQLDEPAFVADRSPDELDALARSCSRLGGLTRRPRILVTAPFGDLGPALPVLAASPVEAVAVDLVRGAIPEVPQGSLAGTTLVAGVVSGRDVWRTDREAALGVLTRLREQVGRVAVGTSCSLLHVPLDLDREPDLDPGLRARLAFADQKVTEVVELARALAGAPATPVPDGGTTPDGARLPDGGTTPDGGPGSTGGIGRGGPGPDEGIGFARPGRLPGRAPYPERAAAQAERLGLPPLPLTTIGSFPQTGEVRGHRADLAAGRITAAEYEERIEGEIERVVRRQERLGLDVLVHGEPERNDMVQYFAEHLDGFATTRGGWVQSYGSRCTRPPILHADVSRPRPITLRWTRYAQSLTPRPVKGMLTGPVTIVAWSFVRPDRPLADVLHQVALAVREEVRDLDAAGVPVIQVDEPALRELLPLRREHQAEYLGAAVAAYRTVTSAASVATQVHTHLCYSRAEDVLEAIDGLDADVTSIESARSGGAVLVAPDLARVARGLGPGVYDIHSPRVPGVDEVEALLTAALRVIPAGRLWVNPDCGLKTRTPAQVEAALANVVAATRRVRAALASAQPDPTMSASAP